MEFGATSPTQRHGGRIVSVAAIFAVLANTGDRRETVGLRFGPGAGRGGRVHADLAWAKLRTLAEGARLASTSLWP